VVLISAIHVKVRDGQASTEARRVQVNVTKLVDNNGK
jgi:hypothetical protein